MASLMGQEFDTLAKLLSEGDPVAHNICRNLWAYALRVDPDTQDRLLVMRTLNQFEIRGTRLAILHGVVCRTSYGMVMAIAHALRLEYLSPLRLNLGFTNPNVLDFRRMLGQIQLELPNFGKEMH
jgi:hypothetical protein